MDNFMIYPPWKFYSHENDHHPIHLILLQTLNLIAAIFIDNTEQKAGMVPELHGIGASKIALATRQQQSASLRLLDILHEVLGEVRRTAEEVFNQVVGTCQVQVRLKSQFLCLSSY
jgi:midasin